MHPPLDRPHPMCQDVINALRDCHDTTSKFKFWGCNDAKAAVDKCFKEEKQELLKSMNKDFEARRQREENAFRDAVGRDVSFEEYLEQDPEYKKAMSEAEERKKKNPSLFSKSAEGRK
uniref:COX assembly mitochondrial protein n=1 Tax=Ditylum brightwellii TaxID=49249 RepID=A0A6V2BJG5_9STRA|mmetsp:Transcript_38236/g.57227  ORF Transcript_38236/g.57227 Transcript_38236/m.57227 type:complete len:118 (+) Transcript_38236:125-478(+)